MSQTAGLVFQICDERFIFIHDFQICCDLLPPGKVSRDDEARKRASPDPGPDFASFPP